jgi:hypothetical protein
MKRLSRVLPADRALRRRHRRRPIAIVLATVLIAALTTALPLAGAHAQAPDAQAPNAQAPNAQAPDAAQNSASRYPDMRAQWTRLGSAQWDPGKPGGRGQQIPYTPEFSARFDAILADRAKGGLENNPTASCIPSGMPRTMIVYETMETIVTPDTTFIRGSYMNELRRIYTDGRDWPATLQPSFMGYSIGEWVDEDHDGRYGVLVVETRGLKGPRTFDGSGSPLHPDNQTIIKERIYLDKADQDILHDDITVIDHALARPWTVQHKYHREHQPFWSEYVCEEGNQQVIVGKENYFVSADGYLMPTKKDQPPPTLKGFAQSQQ